MTGVESKYKEPDKKGLFHTKMLIILSRTQWKIELSGSCFYIIAKIFKVTHTHTHTHIHIYHFLSHIETHPTDILYAFIMCQNGIQHNAPHGDTK